MAKYITYDGFLQLLDVKRMGGNGEAVCRCPAHDDKQASLCVREGDKGIVLKCQAGCRTEDICRSLGVEMRELFKDAGDPPQRRAQAKPAPAKPAAAKHGAQQQRAPKLYGSYQEAYGYLGRLQTVYAYQGDDGRTAFEVARIYEPTGKKTFRQHRPADPQSGNLFPIRLDVPQEIRAGIVYRLAEVKAAMAAGRMIYVVEGEKDADRLAKLGRCATTNPGGAGKWTADHSKRLTGAEVAILADNDDPGREHAAKVLDTLSACARDAWIINLRDGWPEMPDKGDFSDLADALGDEKALSILDELVTKARSDLRQKALSAYAAIPGYGIDNGCICQIGDSGSKMLCSFTALPIEECTVDDGAKIEKNLKIAGWDMDGRALPTVLVPMNKFRTLDWALENWGLTANIMPGNTVKDKLRWVITSAGNRVATKSMIYGHSGWRRIGGRWVYLYQGGCIGADGITVDMGKGLGGYTLDGWPEGMTPEDAAMTSLAVAQVIDEHISVPLLGLTYLAPLYEFLDRANYPPTFVTMLKGAQGSHKSTIAAMFMSHFGRFGVRNLPANFSSTVNYIRRKAFVTKDSLLCIDDYHPVTSMQERRKLEDMMQALTRTFGDRADRGRMDASMGLQESTPPRCLALITGEEEPEVGASGLARLYMIDVEKGDYRYGEEMRQTWSSINDGALRCAMWHYIQWLVPRADEMPARCRALFDEFRDKAHELIAGQATNDRADDAVAHIMIGLRIMLEWMQDLGILNEESTEEQMRQWWRVVIGNACKQGSAGRDESPEKMFVDALQEMMQNGTIWLRNVGDLDGKAPNPRAVMVGYTDGINYYLMPKAAMAEVTKFYQAQGRTFPLRAPALYKQLHAAQMLGQIGNDGKLTRVKFIAGKSMRLLWIPCRVIDGDRGSGAQQIGIPDADGYTEIPADELPPEMR